MKAVDGGWGWMVVVGSCLCHFFLIGINRSMGIVFVLLRERFDVTATQSSLAASIFVSVRALGGPIATKMSDRFGCRAVVMIGGFLLGVGLVFSAVSTTIIHVYITFGVVAGVGGFMVFSPSYVAVSQWFDKKKGKAMALSTLGSGFGSICLAPVVMALVESFNYFGTMLVIGGLLLNTMVGGALYRKPPKTLPTLTKVECELTLTVESSKPAQDVGSIETTENDDTNDTTSSSQKENQDGTGKQGQLPILVDEQNNEIQVSLNDDIKSSQTLTTAAKKQKPTKESIKIVPTVKRICPARCSCRSSLWTNFPFIVYCLLVAAVQGCIQSVLIFLPARGRELGASAQAASLLLTLFGAFDMAGRFVFGFMFDLKWFCKRRTHLYTAVAMAFSIVTAFLAAANSYVTLAAVTCLVALFEGGAHSQRATNVTELVEPSQMSIGVGLVILFQGLGNFYGPLVGGILRDRTGSYSSCFIFGGVTLFIACVLTAIETYIRQRRQANRKRRSDAQPVE
jgi:MFS family permease